MKNKSFASVAVSALFGLTLYPVVPDSLDFLINAYLIGLIYFQANRWGKQEVYDLFSETIQDAIAECISNRLK